MTPTPAVESVEKLLVVKLVFVDVIVNSVGHVASDYAGYASESLLFLVP